MPATLLAVEQTLSEFREFNVEHVEQNIAGLREEILRLDEKLNQVPDIEFKLRSQIKQQIFATMSKQTLLRNAISRVTSYIPIMERLLQELRNGVVEIQPLIELIHVTITTVTVDAIAELVQWDACVTLLRQNYPTTCDDLLRDIIQLMRPHRSIWKMILRKFDGSTELLSDSAKFNLGLIVENNFGKVISFLFEDKEKGAGKYFGGIAIFIYQPYDQTKPHRSVKFFIKGHQNFELESNKTKHSTKDPEPPDMKEILVYKILEHVGYGPKTHYFINDTATYGLFIATQDCNFTRSPELKNKVFRTADEVHSIAEEPSLIDKVEITALDIITRSLVLKDLHARNFGRIDVYSAEGSNAQEKRKWKLFDFLVISNVEEYDNHSRIGEDFIRVQNHPDARFISRSSPAGSILHGEHLAAHRPEVANIALRILEGEMGRGRGAPEMSFINAMGASRQEITKFIEKEGLSLGVDPEEALKDIDLYCSATTLNYQALKERIESIRNVPVK